MLVIKLRPRTRIGKRQIHENRFAMDTGGKYGQTISGRTARRLQRRRDCGGVCSHSPRVRREDSLQDNLSPRQGMCNTAECVSLTSRQMACTFGVGKFARSNSGTTGIFFRVKAESHHQGFTQAPTYWRINTYLFAELARRLLPRVFCCEVVPSRGKSQ